MTFKCKILKFPAQDRSSVIKRLLEESVRTAIEKDYIIILMTLDKDPDTADYSKIQVSVSVILDSCFLRPFVIVNIYHEEPVNKTHFHTFTNRVIQVLDKSKHVLEGRRREYGTVQRLNLMSYVCQDRNDGHNNACLLLDAKID